DLPRWPNLNDLELAPLTSAIAHRLVELQAIALSPGGNTMKRPTLVLLTAIMACSAVGVGAVHSRGRAQQEARRDADRARIAISQALPKMDGDHIEVKLVEVNYAPGQSSEAHSHPCAVIAYVAQGTIRSQVDDGLETLYKPGQTFYEPPNGLHKVSANGSS